MNRLPLGNGKVNFAEYHAFTNASRHSPVAHGAFNYYDKLDGTGDRHISRTIVTVLMNKLDTNS